MPKQTRLIINQSYSRLFRIGPKDFSDAELLAILLNTPHPHAASGLLSQYDGLPGLYQYLQAQPMATLSPSKAAMILAGIELGRRLLRPDIKPGTTIISSSEAMLFLAAQLSQQPNEVFACLFLDSRCRLIKYEELFQGTINEANIYPREIIRRSLLLNAANIILAHNHPSGHSEPSRADIEITHLIQEATHLMDIDVLDHIIIGYPDHFSFAGANLL